MGGSVPAGKDLRATARARRIIDEANEAAAPTRKPPTLTTLAAALFSVNGGGAVAILKALEIEPAALLEAATAQPDQTAMEQLLTIADKERRILGHLHVGTEHLLLAILVHGNNPVARYLKGRDIDATRFRDALVRQLDPNFSPAPD